MGDGSGFFACEKCQREYPWRPALAGRKARCACGHVMQVPAGEPEPQLEEAVATAGGRAGEGAAAGAPELPMHIRLAAEQARKRAARQEREREDAEAELPKESALRDLVLAPVVLAAGIALLFVEAMTAGKMPAATASAAAGVVARAAILKAGLMVVGIMLAAQFLEVALPRSARRSLLSICAIAVGPAAAKGLIQHWIGGDAGGVVAGVFASVALYAVLFHGLLRTNARDTAVCVIVAWALITLADYLAYKYDSYARDSWI